MEQMTTAVAATAAAASAAAAPGLTPVESTLSTTTTTAAAPSAASGKASDTIRKTPAPYPSPYRGVFWSSTSASWRACISICNKSHNIGYFALDVEAALAYDAKAKEYHVNPVLNFLPDGSLNPDRTHVLGIFERSCNSVVGSYGQTFAEQTFVIHKRKTRNFARALRD